MNILPKCRAEKLPNVRLSIDEINDRLKNSTVSVLSYYEYPYIVFCYCTKCEQYYPHKKATLLSNKICSVCANRQIVVGYNDLATLRPDLMQYLTDKSDGEKYTEHSNVIVPCRCPKCGYEKDMQLCNLSAYGFKCPSCDDNNVFCRGKNDIATKAPWMISYLKNKDDAYNYSWKSKEKIDYECPICHRIYNRKIQVVSAKGFSCPCCSDSISFPNKYVRAILSQLPIENLEFEYRRKWTNGRSYDNYFVFKNKQYFVEADGGQHYANTNRSLFIENQENDVLKDKIALKHGIHMIRIDCRDATASYIKRSILQSELADIFDLTCIDWTKCFLEAVKNIAYEVCLEFNKNEKTLVDIAKQFNISYTAVKSYLRQGRQNGIVSQESSQLRAIKIKQQQKENIGAIYDLNHNLLFEFTDQYDAARKLLDFDAESNANNGSIWWCITKSNSKIYKKKYRIELYQAA